MMTLPTLEALDTHWRELSPNVLVTTVDLQCGAKLVSLHRLVRQGGGEEK